MGGEWICVMSRIIEKNRKTGGKFSARKAQIFS